VQPDENPSVDMPAVASVSPRRLRVRCISRPDACAADDQSKRKILFFHHDAFTLSSHASTDLSSCIVLYRVAEAAGQRLIGPIEG
jgi:hypothetical protein